MAREEYLCEAYGSDKDGNERRFAIYKVGKSFKIVNDKLYSHVAHDSRKLTAQDIKKELVVAFGVGNIRLEWPTTMSMSRAKASKAKGKTRRSGRGTSRRSNSRSGRRSSRR